MIYYNARSVLGLGIVFRLHGSIFPRPAILATFVTAVMVGFKLWNEAAGGELFLPITHNPNVYSYFTFMLSFLIVFRASHSYSRFWEGTTALATMKTKYIDSCAQLVSFSSASDVDVMSVALFHQKCVRLVSMLHGMSIAMLFALPDTEIAVMTGLDRCLVQSMKKVKHKPQLILQWLQKLILEEHKAGGVLSHVPPPIMSRTFQELSQGLHAYTQAERLVDVPMPFPYVQLVHFLLLVWCIVIPMIMIEHVEAFTVAVPLCFLSVLGMYGINRICALIETPYGKGLHDLPLLDYQKRVNTVLSELLTMRDEVVALDQETGEEVKAALLSGANASDVAAMHLATLQMEWWVEKEHDLSPLQLVRQRRKTKNLASASPTINKPLQAVETAARHASSPVLKRFQWMTPKVEESGGSPKLSSLKPMRSASLRDLVMAGQQSRASKLKGGASEVWEGGVEDDDEELQEDEEIVQGGDREAGN
mmetsp:Transcript_56982/g.152193  ORF Transcript_56982/g.152193 Transcript_56982/m.152193 type:complete len:478 (+) Transcript_56982:31-1464(+)